MRQNNSQKYENLCYISHRAFRVVNKVAVTQNKRNSILWVITRVDNSTWVYMQMVKFFATQPMEPIDPIDNMLNADPTDPKERMDATENPEKTENMQNMHAKDSKQTILNTENILNTEYIERKLL